MPPSCFSRLRVPGSVFSTAKVLGQSPKHARSSNDCRSSHGARPSQIRSRAKPGKGGRAPSGFPASRASERDDSPASRLGARALRSPGSRFELAVESFRNWQRGDSGLRHDAPSDDRFGFGDARQVSAGTASEQRRVAPLSCGSEVASPSRARRHQTKMMRAIDAIGARVARVLHQDDIDRSRGPGLPLPARL